MTEAEVRQLLAVAMSYDNRKPGQANVAAWKEVADRARWNFDEALDALHQHYAESTDFLMPGHITQRIREKRRQPPPSNLIEAPPKPPADPAHIRAVIAELADRLGWPQRYDSQHPALSNRCPWCKAAPGRPCTRQIARGPKRGQFVAIATPHPSRRDLIKED